MNRLTDKLKDPPWDRLPPTEQAPYLREAREYVEMDVYRDSTPDVTPEEFEDAVRQAAAEIYAEACQRRAAGGNRRGKSRAPELPAIPDNAFRYENSRLLFTMNHTTVWEYCILDKPAPAQFAVLGQQGWELVAVTCIVSGFFRSERAFFKRPRGACPPVLPQK